VAGVVGVCPAPPPVPWLGVVGVTVPPFGSAGVTGVVSVVSVSVLSVSVLSVSVRSSPRLFGVVTPRSAGVVLGSLSPPAVAITTIAISRTRAAAPAATMRRRM
jgi:hypothetical protein